MTETFQCLNCGFTTDIELLDERVCDRCGWSDELPEDDDNYGYE